MRIIKLLFAITILACISCCKQKPVPKVVTKTNTSIVPVDTLALIESKMQGIWNWHGTYEWWCYMCAPQYDSSQSVLDTFGFIISDDSTLVFLNQYGSQYNDTLKLTVYNNSELIFVQSGMYYYNNITYFYVNKSLSYYYTTGGNGMGHTLNLSYP